MSRKRRSRTRDVEKAYPLKKFVATLRRLADALEAGRRFQMRIAGERVRVPPDVAISIEHERGGREEELELELTWKPRASMPPRR